MVNLPVLRTRGTCCAIEPDITNETAQESADLLRVLADPTRLSMLATLRSAAEPVCVCDFVAAYELTQPTISHHMGKLRRAGLVDAHKEGLWTYYQIASPLPGLVDSVLASVAGDSRSLQAAAPR
jgi:ArsR family transcriptional regulator